MIHNKVHLLPPGNHLPQPPLRRQRSAPPSPRGGVTASWQWSLTEQLLSNSSASPTPTANATYKTVWWRHLTEEPNKISRRLNIVNQTFACNSDPCKNNTEKKIEKLKIHRTKKERGNPVSKGKLHRAVSAVPVLGKRCQAAAVQTPPRCLPSSDQRQGCRQDNG